MKDGRSKCRASHQYRKSLPSLVYSGENGFTPPKKGTRCDGYCSY